MGGHEKFGVIELAHFGFQKEVNSHEDGEGERAEEWKLKG